MVPENRTAGRERNCKLHIAHWTLLLFGVLFFVGCSSTVPYRQLTRWEKSGASSGFKAYHFREYGTFAAGELVSGNADIIFDGIYYLKTSGGHALNCPASEELASGWAVRFRADRIDALPENFNDGDAVRRLHELVPDPTMACVFRITGRFSQIQLMNHSGQSFPRSQVAGSLYGYRTPFQNAGVKQEMWFISGDKLCGGRVSSFKLIDGSMAVGLCPNNLTIHTGESQASKQLRK